MESDQALIILVEDRVALPPEPLDQLDVSLKQINENYQSYLLVLIEAVAKNIQIKCC